MKYFKIITAGLLILTCSCLYSCKDNTSNDPGGSEISSELTKEETEKIYNGFEGTQLMRGIWVTPRLTAKDTQEKYDEEYKKIRDAGCTLVYTFSENSSGKQMEKLLNACEKNGIKVIISLHRLENESVIKSNLKLVEKYDSHPAVIGYNMMDEPDTSYFSLLGKEYDSIREICGKDKIIMVNLYPNYASAKGLGVPEGGNPYRTYVESYFEHAKTDALSFDYYPYRADSAGDENNYAKLVANLCEIMKAAGERNLPAWGFVQCGEWGGTRTPKTGELRLLSHFHLAFGLKSFTYFLYVTPTDGETSEGFFKGMVEYDGTVRETYNRVRDTGSELDAMKGVYLSYDFKGVIMKNVPSSWEENVTENYKLTEFAPLKDISSGSEENGFVCGCFGKETGEKGLYIVNADAYYGQEAFLVFDKAVDYRVWSGNGIEKAGRASKINLEFNSGEGKFIEILAENKS